LILVNVRRGSLDHDMAFHGRTDMQAQDVMTRRVESLAPEATLLRALTLMLDLRVSGLPVIDDSGRLVGILTEGDLLRRAENDTERAPTRWKDFLFGPGRQAAEYVHSHSRQVADLMTREVVTVTQATPLADVVGLMEARHIKRVVVCDGDQVVGLISRADLLRALRARLEQAASPAPLPDIEIYDRIMAEFAQQLWAPADSVKVDVDAGIVVLDGVIMDERDRAAMLVVARNIPGVKAVRDHLTWVEPTTGATLEPDM